MNLPFRNLLIALLLIAGLALWWCNYNARGLFLDEANLALNVSERSFGGLWQALAYEQYAPPLYLSWTKALATLFGYDEGTLRLTSLIGSCLGLAGLHLAGKSLKLGAWSWAPIALFFASPICLRYSGEFKPYALDLGLAAILLAWGMSQPKARWYWALIGALLVWLSMPIVFSLAAVGFYLLWTQVKHRRQWITIFSVWGMSFLLYYWLLLAGDSNSSNLQDFHATYFFPYKFWTAEAWQQAGRLIQLQLKHPFGFTVLAQVWGGVSCLLIIRACWRSKLPTAIPLLLIGPWLLALFASSIGKYSLIPRLMLFSYPGLWLLVILAWASLFQSLTNRWKWLLPAGVLIIISGTNVVRHYAQPIQVGQVKEMLEALPPEQEVYVQYWAVPAVRYYREVHQPPLGPVVNYQLATEPAIDKQDPPFSILYSMETIEQVQAERRQDSLLLHQQGFQLISKPFVRGHLLLVDNK